MSGKVDQSALPQPTLDRTMLGVPFVPPRTAIEERLTEIWTEILGWPQIGIHDDFLALGGDSLRATQLISRVQDHFHVDLPLQALFNAPTIADMTLVLMPQLAQSDQVRAAEQK